MADLEEELLREMETESECSEAAEEEASPMFLSWSGKARLNLLGEDVLIRIFSMLPVTKLCTMALVCQWLRKVSGKDVLWKALYLERWADPKSHIFARDALREGWKKVYASKDMDIKAQDENEALMSSIKCIEDKECQDAFRAMQAAKRSLSLNKKATPKQEEGNSAMDLLQNAILEFKSRCKFPHAGHSSSSGSLGVSLPPFESGTKVNVDTNGVGEQKRSQSQSSMFGKGGFFTSCTAGPFRDFLAHKKIFPRKHQLEVCICKLTGELHMCSYDGLARGCELSLPNDDGYFVCPITGIIWCNSRLQVAVEEDEDEP
ncbi:hypothetical protein GUITHDRAFT_113315 [Guillardia theta CCMP2712]|uniref:F-box domain-containing protein n=2 Tax=Guillardia theta TaxID=55529 RepID=L1IXB5_GUITC|nr:hypothetical protein GUITHDRAFT_113315 [Guillardia theta CCMP2712]EKX40529.1 hypothetical protein GUITHDRAFT_113315 [Guillardia theta CCMP2712]|mmetsp:Transcript_17535/g.57868  ORF Transcript_17535/g.57868 Transcript_17535/m.57868 type:complete len:318 (+) Transcript_17535:54-1007(+)|eukprot:XP_005827509.1 hypothetical protein GUITHDRAFT_113315 [Guillardia theta CCMP2712]